MGDNRDLLSNPNDFHNLTIANNFYYCKLHGYEFKLFKYQTQFCSPEGKKRTFHWNKIKAVQQVLAQYENVVWIDSDALFVTRKGIQESMDADELLDFNNCGRIFANDRPSSFVNVCSCFFIL